MATSLDDLLTTAAEQAKRGGFRTTGVYHLLRAVRLREEGVLSGWLAAYRVDELPFLKFLENVLRPRRAGGGVPRDRIDAALLAELVEKARRLAAEQGVPADAEHVGQVLGALSEDPIVSLCERYLLDCQPPERS